MIKTKWGNKLNWGIITLHQSTTFLCRKSVPTPNQIVMSQILYLLMLIYPLLTLLVYDKSTIEHARHMHISTLHEEFSS